MYYDCINSVPLSFQAIMEKKACKRSFFSFGKLIKLVLLLLVAAIAIDIYKHKGYKGRKLFVVSLRLSLFQGLHRLGNGQGEKFFEGREKSGNFILSQGD